MLKQIQKREKWVFHPEQRVVVAEDHQLVLAEWAVLHQLTLLEMVLLL
jgi:hypothetical protein